MKMTWKLAETLMDCLCYVAFSANGTIDGPTEEDMEKALHYARNRFESLLAEWEDLTGKEWDIEDPDENND